MATSFITINLTEPNYLTLADYERAFDLMYWRRKWIEYWVMSVYLSAIYLLLLYGGVVYMKQRKPFKLNGLLTVWNIGLSVMSIWAFMRCFPELFHILSIENGFYHSVCEWKDHSPATAFWGFVLTLSKAIELGDTAFIVLRKTNLPFLHYYHHVVTLMSYWYMYSWYEPVQLWYATLNAFVHSLMYPYYTFRALKIAIPKVIAMSITSLQLLQMFIGIIINSYSFFLMYFTETSSNCPHRSWVGLSIGAGVYASFAFLFAKFFVTSYLIKRIKKSKKV